MSLTIESVIASETRRGVLLASNIGPEVTDEVRAMTVYHHEFARDLDPGYPGVVCLMFVGTADRGCIVAHWMNPTCAMRVIPSVGGFHILGTD